MQIIEPQGLYAFDWPLGGGALLEGVGLNKPLISFNAFRKTCLPIIVKTRMKKQNLQKLRIPRLDYGLSNRSMRTLTAAVNFHSSHFKNACPGIMIQYVMYLAEFLHILKVTKTTFALCSDSKIYIRTRREVGRMKFQYIAICTIRKLKQYTVSLCDYDG